MRILDGCHDLFFLSLIVWVFSYRQTSSTHLYVLQRSPCMCSINCAHTSAPCFPVVHLKIHNLNSMHFICTHLPADSQFVRYHVDTFLQMVLYLNIHIIRVFDIPFE